MNGEPESSDKLMYESAVYREQLRLLQREIERMNLTIMELNSAISTAEGIKKDEILVSVGGGSFLRATVSNTNILLPVGAGYMLEIEREQAGSEIKRRVEATQKAIEKLNDEYDKIAKRLQDINRRLRTVKAQETISKRVDENIGEDYL